MKIKIPALRIPKIPFPRLPAFSFPSIPGISIPSLFEKKHKRLVVEAASAYLKWVVARPGGTGGGLLEAGAFRLAEEREVAVEKLAALVKKHRIPPQGIFSCVPRYQATARNLELPSTLPQEIKKIIDLQAVKQTPYAADEIVYDYYLLNTFREGYSSVMLVIVHREVINSHLKALEEAGLKPASISLATQGAVTWIAASSGIAQDEVTAVIDVDSQHADFFIFRGSHILFTQNISVGAEKLAEDGPKWQERLLSELSRSLQIYRSEEIAKEPTKLLLAGAYEGLRSAMDRLGAASGLNVQEVPNPGIIQKLLGSGIATADLAGKISFSSVFGLAAQSKAPLINLVPQEVLIQSTLVEKGRRILITAFLSLSIFLTVISLFLQDYYRRQTYLKWLGEKSSLTRGRAEETRRERLTIREATKLHDANAQIFDAILKIHSLIPGDLYCTDISFTKDRHLQIQGRAETMSSVLEFVNSLKAEFQQIETKRLTKRVQENKEVVDFEIDSVLTSAASGGSS